MNRLARSLGALFTLGFIQSAQLLWFPKATQAQVSSGAICAVPGKDGVDFGAINIVNSYFPGPSADTTVNAGSTSIPVGSINSSGSQTAISPGDLLLIIQMQDADIDYTDTSNYGAGNGTGSGSTDIHSTGLYEYVVANNSVGTGGGIIQIQGTGLLNRYRQEAATAAHGQRTYQVVRVPQYTNAALSGTIRSPGAWDGKSGGIVVIDVANTFTFSNGTVEVQDKGFRGGGGTTNTDTYPDKEDEAFRTDGDVSRGGVKGEGIAGTPLYVFDGTSTTNTGTDGYPRSASQDSYTTIGNTDGGSRARGAPGNAGGGGNQHNAGGGGGGNWGAGGQGGNSINSPPIDETPSTGVSKTVGGRGGAPFTAATVKRLVMGGGGGAGDANNGVAGSGGLGGGIVLIRAGTITGTGSISARARDGVVTPTDDGGSGAGAGGSIVIAAKSGSLAGIALNANGGKGGDTNTNTTVPYDFGPGAGGGGGVIFSSLPVSTATVSGGQPGESFNGQLGTSTSGVTRGATAGSDGKIEVTETVFSNPPGVLSGADCSVNLSGQVWKDANGSITKDSGEVGTDAGGLYVYLVDSSGNVLTKSSVQSDGTYSIVAPINTSATLRLSADGSKNYGQAVPAAGLPNGWFNTGENKNGVTETATPGEIAIATQTSSIPNQNFGILEFISPSRGKIVINEVLYRQTGGNGANVNDEFIELYNASSESIDIGGWKLIDGNLILNDLDGTSGSITGKTTPYIFPPGTILGPNQYAVVWVGEKTSSNRGSGANLVFEDWLGIAAKLLDTGDDIWLYDSQTRIVDYIAYGTGTSINTPPPAALGFWNDASQASLATISRGQSISLTRNGLDTDTSNCWEQTTSGNASNRTTNPCPNSLLTRDIDEFNRTSSAGDNNNGLSTNLLLVKRITSINGSTNLAVYNQIDAYPYDDNAIETNLTSTPQYPRPDTNKWPNTVGKSASSFLLGAVNGGNAKPKDEVEYTIYFLSTGIAPAQRVTLCDRIPTHQTFVPNGYNSVPQALGGNQTDRGIAVSYAGNYQSFTNINDGDTAQYFAPQTALPAACGTAANTTGAVVINLGMGATNALGGTVPHAIAPNNPTSSYGFVRFKAKVN
jgi:uncharacterized repeat protein (TIGR01451 family)